MLHFTGNFKHKLFYRAKSSIADGSFDIGQDPLPSSAKFLNFTDLPFLSASHEILINSLKNEIADWLVAT